MERVFAALWRLLVAAALLGFVAPPVLAALGLVSGADLVNYLQQVVSGAALGCVYALVALGIVLIYKATETINFAQGELMMLGAFLCFTFVAILGLPFWAGALLGIGACAVLGMATDRIVVRPVVGQPAFAIVMVTLGFGFVARSLASVIPGWGTDTHTIVTPFANQIVALGPVVISQDHAAIIVATALLCGLLYLFFTHTKLGLAMQAASQNQLAAYYMGIPVKTVFTMIWGVSAGVAAIAGLMLAPIAFVHTQMGMIIFKAFPAAVLGGFGSIPGAIVGGLVIGIVEALAGFYLPEGFKDVAAYVVLLVVLLLKPEGIFGHVRKKKV
ncbi:MAG: branched-chain amino acid ABC transporter permease [Steroidobacteraceae bacterium]|jgi:branched-chain amino acid transport system permease protein|nr:branched-chain amino acid ABC transporter permease [Steroidobacteraceae bacterium]